VDMEEVRFECAEGLLGDFCAGGSCVYAGNEDCCGVDEGVR
jgi:hypothetical protein